MGVGGLPPALGPYWIPELLFPHLSHSQASGGNAGPPTSEWGCCWQLPRLLPSHPNLPADSSSAGLPGLPVPIDSTLARPSQTHQLITLASLASAALVRPPSCHCNAPGLSWTPLSSLPCLGLTFDVCSPFELTSAPHWSNSSA